MTKQPRAYTYNVHALFRLQRIAQKDSVDQIHHTGLEVDKCSNAMVFLDVLLF